MWHFLDNDNTDHGPFTADQMGEWYQKGLFPKAAGTEIRLGHWAHFYNVHRVFADRQAVVGPPFVSLVGRVVVNVQLAAEISGTAMSSNPSGGVAEGAIGISSGGVAEGPQAELPRIACENRNVI